MFDSTFTRYFCLLLLRCSCFGGDLPAVYSVSAPRRRWRKEAEEHEFDFVLACSSTTYFLVRLTKDPYSTTTSQSTNKFCCFSSPLLSHVPPISTVSVPAARLYRIADRYRLCILQPILPFVSFLRSPQESNHEVHLARRLPRPDGPLRRRGRRRFLRAPAGWW